jgi:hypothetical protein
MHIQKVLSAALLARMEQLERRLERKYQRYIARFVPDEEHPHYVTYGQWVDGEKWAVELEAHKQAFYTLPINK